MRPDRLAVYNYAHLPQRFKGQRMIDADDIPAPEVKLEILQLTIDGCSEAGYCYIGMDHFALPDDDLVGARESRTLQTKLPGLFDAPACDLVGLGVSSISTSATVLAETPYDHGVRSTHRKRRLPIRKGIAWTTTTCCEPTSSRP